MLQSLTKTNAQQGELAAVASELTSLLAALMIRRGDGNTFTFAT